MRARTAELWSDAGAVILTAVTGMVLASRAAWRRIARRMVTAGGTAAVEELVEELLSSEVVRAALVAVIQEVNAPVVGQLEAIHGELAEMREWRATASRLGARIDDHERRLKVGGL